MKKLLITLFIVVFIFMIYSYLYYYSGRTFMYSLMTISLVIFPITYYIKGFRSYLFRVPFIIITGLTIGINLSSFDIMFQNVSNTNGYPINIEITDATFGMISLYGCIKRENSPEKVLFINY